MFSCTSNIKQTLYGKNKILILKRAKFEWASQGVPRYFHLPPTVVLALETFTYVRLSVGTTPWFSKIMCKHDKSQPMVPINSLQPHEHHGTIINGQLFLYEKSLKTNHVP